MGCASLRLQSPARVVESSSAGPLGVEARIYRFGAVVAQTRLTARDTLTAGGGWNSPHPGGDVPLDWADTVMSVGGARRRLIPGYPDGAGWAGPVKRAGVRGGGRRPRWTSTTRTGWRS